MLSSKKIRFKLMLTLFFTGMMLHQSIQAQCDFINNITGITQTVLGRRQIPCLHHDHSLCDGSCNKDPVQRPGREQ